MTSERSKWRDCALIATATIQDVIDNLESSSTRIVLVINDKDQLMGTISDGDLRRGLLRGLQLKDSIESLIYPSPVIVSPSATPESVRGLMLEKKILQIPVVDEDKKVVGLYLWDDFSSPAKQHHQMIIMAGGKGTRLRPFTENTPKPLVQIAGKPMLEHIIRRAQAEGFSDFILAIHHLGHAIEEFFQDGSRFGVKIHYLRETHPLGTAGALSLLDPPPDNAFVVTNGDVITDIRYTDLLDFHHRHEAAATMAVRSHEWQHPYGVVHTEGLEIKGFEEKPINRSYINAGIYILSPKALEALEPGVHCDMPTLFERLRERSESTIAYPMHEPWLDVGRPSDLEKARQSLDRDEVRS